MRTIAGVVLLLILVAPRIGSQQSITFCELLRHPDEYNDRGVTVRATLRYGFETQDLYCLSCRDVGRIRLELVDDPDAKISDSDRIEKATCLRLWRTRSGTSSRSRSTGRTTRKLKENSLAAVPVLSRKRATLRRDKIKTGRRSAPFLTSTQLTGTCVAAASPRH